MTTNELPFDIDLDDEVQNLVFEFQNFGVALKTTKSKNEKKAINQAFRARVMEFYPVRISLLNSVLNFGKMLKKKKLESVFYKNYSRQLKKREEGG